MLNTMRRQPSTLIPERDRGELALLEGLRRRANSFRNKGLCLGIGDDCALLRVKPDEEVTITTDLSIAGRHFRLDLHPAEVIGHRTLARGLSDTAAMGARPLAAFLSLGLPRELTRKRGRGKPWIEGFLDGFLTLAAEHQTSLAGGDMAESPVAVGDIVLVGAVPRGQALLRSGAQPGDLVYVTGMLGGAAAGLSHLLRRKTRMSPVKSYTKASDHPVAAHFWPQPRIEQGIWLRRKRAATAAIDISDGLSTDLDHLCTESNVCAEIDAEALPVYPGATLEEALHGGEDYEILFTASATTRIPGLIAGVPATPIGRIVKKGRSDRDRISLLTATGRQTLQSRGWQHFA